jgi:class 3 adenylate cyclase
MMQNDKTTRSALDERSQMDVASWLRDLGLGQYERAFRENEIDDKVLTRLTVDDLKDLGVAMVGHRRRLLDAIAALGAVRAEIGRKEETSTVPSDTGEPLRDDLLRSIPRGAERRQLTVMFCDLVGSTALSAQLDPEEMQEVLRDYQNAVTGEIVRIEGHVAKLMGDGVLAFFGWPTAHEDEAERGVRAGLAIVEAVKRLGSPSGEALACRVGIATGLVVVGDLVGVGVAQEEAVVGETPNLAARLQQLASPGAVVVAEATHRLVSSRFETENLGEHALRGWVEPIVAYRIVAERPVESRFAARHGSALVPMVGRDEELALLLRHWREAVGGEGRAVLILGEPGIGKSRLARALRDAAVAPDGAEVVLCQCSPFHTDSPLWPIIQSLSLAAGFGRDDDVMTKRAKFAALLCQSADARDGNFEMLAPLLGLPLDPDLLTTLTPQERRTRALDALVTQIEGRTRRAPVLFLIEDAHWLDPTSIELVQRVLDVVANIRLLLVFTSRPGGQLGIGSWPNLRRLTLHRLARQAAERMVGGLAATRSFRDEIRSEIVARTDGVPLFIEEVTKAMLEATPTGRDTVVPATLQDSLLARLDRTPIMKAVAQVAACIGREFDHQLLAGVADLAPGDLEGGLDLLLQAELIFRRGVPPKMSYIFKHSLVRDVAYQSLLKPRRRELHGRIVKMLRGMGHDDGLEFIAYHATQAEHADAAELWFAAGTQAARRYANVEALRHFEQAHALVDPSSGGADRLRLGILKAMGPPLFAVHGYAAPVVEETYQAAAALAEQNRWVTRVRSSELYAVCGTVSMLARNSTEPSGWPRNSPLSPKPKATQRSWPLPTARLARCTCTVVSSGLPGMPLR